MLPSEELLQSIDILAQNAVKDSVKIYTAIVTAVADNGTCSVRVNGKMHSNVAYYGDVPIVNKSYRVFCPNGSMNQAFIITGGGSSGGGGTGATDYNQLTNRPSINGMTLSGNQTSSQLGLYGTNNTPPYPVTSVNGQTGNVVIPTGGNVDSVNGKTGEVVLNSADVGALPSTTVIPDKVSQLENDSGYITNGALTGYAKKTEIPTKTSQLDNDSHYITATEAPVQSVNTKTGAVVLTQDDIGDGTTYVRTHNDFTDALKTQINTNEDNIAMAESDIDGLQTDVGTLKTNVTSLQTALTSKQDVIVGAASTITEDNLATDRALVSNSSGKVAVSNVTSTELGYLDGVTSNVQTQLDKKLEKAPVTSVNSKTGAVQLNASDVGALPDTTVIPSKTSQLDNDVGYVNAEQAKNAAPVQSVNGQTGVVVIDIPEPYELPIASTTQLGGVKVGAGLSVTENGILSATGGGTADAVEWNNVLDTPTTIAGYGITDAKIENGTITLGDKTITPLTSAPVTSVNSKTGDVVLGASDVGAISTSDVTQTLGTSTTKVPSEKAVSDALSAAGAGDMLKSTYDPDGSVATAGGIPNYVEANGGKIDTIKVNGTAQAITDKTVDITVPTKTSDLINDSGYLTSAPVTSVNSKTGAVVLTANDVGALPADTVIPTVNDATLTISRNGTDIGSFTANSADNVNVDIQVPTDKSDIGLGNVDNVKQYSASNPPPYPVTSVNGQTGDVTVEADLPEHLVKYQSLTSVEATTIVDADKLQGHDAAYFATASALNTTNSNVSTNTSDISTLQSGLSTANANIANKLDKSGGTMTGALVAQNNANYTTAQVRNIIISTADPSGGSNGDIWIRYTE